jgi:hypothetical protein
MVNEYTSKLVFHIPHYAWENESLVEVDYKSFKKNFCGRLLDEGFTSWCTTSARGYYKGREAEEELLTLFCNDNAEAAISAFKTAVSESKSILRQEEYAYEHNGVLYVGEF